MDPATPTTTGARASPGGVFIGLDRCGVAIGTLALAGFLLLLPAGGSPGDLVRMPLAIGVLTAFVLVVVGRSTREWASRGLLLAMLAFGASYAVSIAASLDPERSAIRSAGIPMSIVVGVLAMRLGASPKAMRVLGLAAGLAVVVLMVDLLWQRTFDVGLIGGLPRTSRQQGSLPNANDVAMVVPLAALATAGVDLRGIAGRLAALGLIGAMLTAWQLSDSRNLLLGIAGAGVAFVLLRDRVCGRVGRGTLIVGLLLGSLLLPWTSLRHRVELDRMAVTSAISPREDAASGSESRGPSIIDRLAKTSRGRIFGVAVRTAAAFPILGCGPGLFAEAWWHFEGGAAWGEIAPDVGYMPWAHNLWLEAAAERGSIGLAALLLLAATWMGLVGGVWRARPEGGDAFVSFAATASAAFGLLAMSLFDLTLLKDWVGLLLLLSFGASSGAAVALSEGEAVRVRGGRRAMPPTTVRESADGSTA